MACIQDKGLTPLFPGFVMDYLTQTIEYRKIPWSLINTGPLQG
jgi:hypothetical protein